MGPALAIQVRDEWKRSVSTPWGPLQVEGAGLPDAEDPDAEDPDEAPRIDPMVDVAEATGRAAAAAGEGPPALPGVGEVVPPTGTDGEDRATAAAGRGDGSAGAGGVTAGTVGGFTFGTGVVFGTVGTGAGFGTGTGAGFGTGTGTGTGTVAEGTVTLGTGTGTVCARARPARRPIPSKTVMAAAIRIPG